MLSFLNVRSSIFFEAARRRSPVVLGVPCGVASISIRQREFCMGSVIKKRRKKIRKHKFKKLLKRMRHRK